MLVYLEYLNLKEFKMLHSKRTYIAGLLLAGLLVGCGSGDDSEANESHENNEQQENQEEHGTDGTTQPNPPSTTGGNKMFTADVMPVLNNKCKSCHGSKGNFTITTPDATYANISDLKASVQTAGQYLIDKGSNTVGHGGGNVISTTSTEYATIKSWVDAGADFN